jgi:oligoribonuclease
VIVFCDLETTGLDPEKHAVLEVALVITDDALADVPKGAISRVVHWPRARFMLNGNEYFGPDRCAEAHDVDPFVLDMHTKNGLWQASANSGDTLAAVDRSLATFITERCGGAVGEKKGPQLGGNTISFDRAFLKRHLPLTHATLHYRNVDCTTLNEMAKRFWPAVYEGRPRAAKDAAVHRAEADVMESVELARYYSKALCPSATVLPVVYEAVRETLTINGTPSPEDGDEIEFQARRIAARVKEHL